MNPAKTTSFELFGLSEQEVIARRATGLGHNAPIQTSRTYLEIVRTNLFTFINIVFFFISLILAVLGRWEDIVIALVILLNVVVNIFQEVKAKQKLDRITLLTRPKAIVIRDGEQQLIDPSGIVLGDVLVTNPGDQIVVDGSVVGNGKMNVDESLLTGESDLMPKQAGDPVYSGSYCISGAACYVAEKVGKDSLANQLTAGAKAHRQAITPLQKEINLIVRILLVIMIFLWLLLAISLIIGLTSFVMSVQIAAVIAGLVPAGLYLMITLSYALGVGKMIDQSVLIQQLNAVESISNIDVLCLDKTGTLTTNRIQLLSVHPIEDNAMTVRSLLGDYAASVTGGNRTNEAITVSYPGKKRTTKLEIPFASAYKWSGISFADPQLPGIYIMGAPEILNTAVLKNPELKQVIKAGTVRGLRVLLFVHSSATVINLNST